MSRVGEVWDTGSRVLLVLEEDESNAYPEESVCVVLILYDVRDERIGMTTGLWVPKAGYEEYALDTGRDAWKRIASF